jgi:alginate O-acetyltransferase complex protein AlgJ
MLTRDQVASVYRQVLGREPNDRDIEDQLAAVSTLDDLLRVALDSDEYAARLRGEKERNPWGGQHLVNTFHPDLAPWSLPPGTRSEDGAAIVGHEGWLFLCGGTNANLGQYVGAVEPEPAWLEEWREVIVRRAAQIEALGMASALLVVPDKLAVYEDFYPERLTRVGPRPIERLLAEDMPIVYPLEELRAAAASGEEVYVRTDTHLTFRGNELLFSSVAEGLGIEDPPDLSGLELHSHPIAGDLGVKFDPQIVSIVNWPDSLRDARIVEDNRDEIVAVDGHIGTRRVFRNDDPPDQRVAVLFGDSFGFAAGGSFDPAAAYYQGLSWFLAQVFREVHFVWVPFGWDSEYVRRVGAEAVLVQGAERFVSRVPHVEVDASSLAEATVRRRQAIGVEQVFD